MSSDIERFLACRRFIVAGASTNRAKYGNKVLRCYLQNDREAIPLNPRADEIEGVAAVASLSEIQDPASCGLSIITPPAITEQIIAEAADLGVPAVWMQPGAESDRAVELAQEAGMVTIHGGPCLLVVLGYSES